MFLTGWLFTNFIASAARKTHDPILAVTFPFICTIYAEASIENLDIAIDIINGDFPFLIVLPSLLKMLPNLNFNHRLLGMRIGKKFLRITLPVCENNIVPPFNGHETRRTQLTQEKIHQTNKVLIL